MVGIGGRDYFCRVIANWQGIATSTHIGLSAELGAQQLDSLKFTV